MKQASLHRIRGINNTFWVIIGSSSPHFKCKYVHGAMEATVMAVWWVNGIRTNWMSTPVRISTSIRRMTWHLLQTRLSLCDNFVFSHLSIWFRAKNANTIDSECNWFAAINISTSTSCCESTEHASMQSIVFRVLEFLPTTYRAVDLCLVTLFKRDDSKYFSFLLRLRRGSNRRTHAHTTHTHACGMVVNVRFVCWEMRR